MMMIKWRSFPDVDDDDDDDDVSIILAYYSTAVC